MKHLFIITMMFCCQVGFSQCCGSLKHHKARHRCDCYRRNVIQTGASQGCIIGGPQKLDKYVCYDGRTLKRENGQFIWHARRGCFKSVVPCCAYKAQHYAYTPNPENLAIAFFRCQEGYPFHLGEMQTH